MQYNFVETPCKLGFLSRWSSYEDPNLRIESFAIVKLRSVSTKLYTEIYIHHVKIEGTYWKLICLSFHGFNSCIRRMQCTQIAIHTLNITVSTQVVGKTLLVHWYSWRLERERNPQHYLLPVDQKVWNRIKYYPYLHSLFVNLVSASILVSVMFL